MKRTRPFVEKIDARTTRKDRSRQAILGAYVQLVTEMQRQPTALQIAERAGCSLRLIFQHFPDLPSLTLAAAQIAYLEGRTRADEAKLDGDRQTRISTHMARRARNCEAWLPLWRVGFSLKDQSPELRQLGALIRKGTLDRLAEMYAPELATLSEVERQRLLIGLEAVIDYESWGRLRDEYGLSVEQATQSWISIVDRMLPPTPGADAVPSLYDPLANGGDVPLAL